MTPVCPCHGEPKVWKNDRHASAGGAWLCSVKLRARELKTLARQAEHRRLNPKRLSAAPLHALLDRLDPEQTGEEIALEMEASGFWADHATAARVLRRIRNQEWLKLNTLDRLLIALGMEHLWHTTPEWSVA